MHIATTQLRMVEALKEATHSTMSYHVQLTEACKSRTNTVVSSGAEWESRATLPRVAGLREYTPPYASPHPSFDIGCLVRPTDCADARFLRFGSVTIHVPILTQLATRLSSLVSHTSLTKRLTE